jgi:hypothetical protein
MYVWRAVRTSDAHLLVGLVRIPERCSELKHRITSPGFGSQFQWVRVDCWPETLYLNYCYLVHDSKTASRGGLFRTPSRTPQDGDHTKDASLSIISACNSKWCTIVVLASMIIELPDYAKSMASLVFLPPFFTG